MESLFVDRRYEAASELRRKPSYALSTPTRRYCKQRIVQRKRSNKTIAIISVSYVVSRLSKLDYCINQIWLTQSRSHFDHSTNYGQTYGLESFFWTLTLGSQVITNLARGLERWSVEEVFSWIHSV